MTALGSQPHRGKLTERAYDYIREGILRGQYPVGSVLPESEIAEALGHSRTPIRHALGRLLHEGLVEVGPRRQLLVRGFTHEHRAEVLALRMALETISVRRACEAMTIEDVDGLRLLLIRQRRAADAPNEDDFIELDEQFHLSIAEGARLPILIGFLGQLRGFVRVLRLETARHPRHMSRVVTEHEQIVDAIERRDADAAEALLREHLNTTEYVLNDKRHRKRSVKR
jgi:DNA-binding GntR family transcriptional regulator